MAEFKERAAEAPKSLGLEVRPMPKIQKLKLESEKRSREVSQIGFPYSDLESAISIARALLTHGNQLTRDQLAGAMGQSPSSGAFIIKVSTARQFGLVDTKDGRFQLTDLGFSILDKSEAREKLARVQAFLTVPLYRKLYEDFKGKQLPPRPHGLEHTIVQMGVAPKQRSNARLAFERSAKQAGFFNVDPDRLIEPVVGGTQMLKPSTLADRDNFGTATAATENELPQALDPLIQGLLSRLPNPGDPWSVEKRRKWLQTLAANLDIIYPNDGDASEVNGEHP